MLNFHESTSNKNSTSIHRKKTLRPFLLRKSISGALRLVADVNFRRGDPSISPTMQGTFEGMMFPFLFGGGICFFSSRICPKFTLSYFRFEVRFGF